MRSRVALSLVFFCIALLIAYGIEWAPYYVSLVSGGELKVMGRLAEWRGDCPKAMRGTNRCADRYQIPASVLADFRPGMSLGMGISVYATEVSCVDDPAKHLTFGDVATPGRVLDITTCYQRSDFERLSCRAGVTIDAWSPAHYRRHGFGGSSVVVGKSFLVERVGKLVEFFVRTLPNILAAVLIGVFAINSFLRTVSHAPLRTSGFERYLPAWIGLCVVGSGLAQVVIPWAPAYPAFSRFSNGMNVIAHLGSGLAILSQCFGWRRISGRWITGFGALFALSPWFGLGLAPLTAAQSIAYGAAGVLGRSPLLVGLSLAMAADCTRLFNWPFAPHGHVGLLFTFLTVGASFVSRILNTAHLMDAIRWARDTISSSHHDADAETILANFAKYFGIPRVAIVDGAGHPEARWHVRTENGTYLTILPVMKNDRRLAAIALGGYGDLHVLNEERRLAFQTVLEMLLPFLAELIAHRTLTEEMRRVETALAGFVPTRVLKRVIDGSETRETELGYLVMADLKESTRLSRIMGAETWLKFVRGLSEPVEEIAARHGYALQSIVWDAFYLTRAAPANAAEISRATALAQELRGFFMRVYRERLGQVTEYPARFCFVHGDISRDLHSGINKSWTIVGGTMAEVSKLEQACKNIEGWLFASHSAILRDAMPPGWIALDVAVQATGEPIYAHAA